MAYHSHNASGSLEDSLRQMIISGGSHQNSSLFDSSPERGNHPAVRLPPSSSYGPPPVPAADVLPPHSRNQSSQQPSYPSHQGRNGYQNGNHPYPQSPGPRGRQQRMQTPYGQSGMNRPLYAQHTASPPKHASPGPQQRARHQQQMQIDPNAFGHRGNYNQTQMARGGRSQYLFNPHQARGPMPSHRDQQHELQTQYLDHMASMQISQIDMPRAEYEEKEAFRNKLDDIVRQVCGENAGRLPQTSLQAFGSFKSGFATAGSDMDLVIVVEDQISAAACFSLLEDDLPRTLEKRLLELGYGARLLTRTRVPIIKVCEKPGTELLGNLRKERQKWDVLSEEEKYPHLYQREADEVVVNAETPVDATPSPNIQAHVAIPVQATDGAPSAPKPPTSSPLQDAPNPEATPLPNEAAKSAPRRDDSKPWTRERKAGPLDFPSQGVGIHSDVNFFNPLGLHNTQLLRCYSICDDRVRPIILFVKAWAKARKVNSSYSGTLSSYGYVLMVLHFLVNVARPPVLPNLQNDYNPFRELLPDARLVDNWPVRFWRDEGAIATAAHHGQLSQNRESIGSLLVGFFHYYSSLGGGRSFHWMQSVLSLRSPGGILTKEEKGWVRAVTEEGKGKKIQHRYLFCIEDPFELDHNVARTVTHKGIVAIRDEFRRAHRILLAIGYGQSAGEELCAEMVETVEVKPEEAGPQKQQQSSADPARGQTKQPHAHSGLDMRDQNSFPALGSAMKTVPALKKKGPSRPVQDGEADEYSEISGDKAKVYLAEVRRKRDEAAAESTARFAAESVLDDFD